MGGSDALFARLAVKAERYRELEQALADPELHGQPARLTAFMREMGALRAQTETYDRWAAFQARAAEAREMLADGGELADLAREELAEVEAELEAMLDAARQEVADDEPNRGRDLIVEIRAGAGGDEASLFAGDLVRIYGKFLDEHGVKHAVIAAQPTDVGGFKEIVLELKGASAWDLMRFESGGHRVQRVPETEAQGRIHTSAATVAVLAEAEEEELDVQESDLRIDVYRSSGPGGQNVNKTSSAIRITHLPTNTVVQCQDESSQHKNKSRALRMLRARLKEAADLERKAEEDSTRRSMIGSGDRSERIRTYNYPQNRVTDHRIKTNYGLEQVLLGRLDPLVEDLRRHDLERKLAALDDGAI